MRYGKWITALMLLVLPAIAAAQLPAANQVVADVPFTFVVADTVVPLGHCIVQRAGTLDQALLIRSPNARHEVFALASANDGKTASETALIFHRYGRRYFLAGVKVEGSRTVYLFKPSKFEVEMMAQNVPATEQILLASIR